MIRRLRLWFINWQLSNVMQHMEAAFNAGDAARARAIHDNDWLPLIIKKRGMLE